MKNLKSKSLLTMLMVLALLVATASMAFADFNAFLVKADDGKFYEYNSQELNDSYTAFQVLGATSPAAAMYNQFVAIGGSTKVVALGDSVKGWMDYAAAQAANIAAQIADVSFVINDYFATPAATLYGGTVTNPIVVNPDGTLTPTVDLAAYEAAVAQANAAVQADYTAATWAALQTALTDNVVTDANTQAEIDAATTAITNAYNALAMIPKVTSVSAINARQFTVTFSTAMDKTTLLANTTTSATNDDYVLAAAMQFTPLEAQPAVSINGGAGDAVGSLSADGKTLTVTLGGTEFLTGNYTVVVNKSVKATSKLALAAIYTTNINVKDTARPTLAGVTYTNFQTADIGFSEPIATAGTITFKLADGTDLAVQPNGYSVVDGKIQVNLTAVTDLNKDITATIIGAKDFAGNVISPNPITVTLIKNTSDTTKPTVSSVTVTSNTTFDIKFSEALLAPPTIATIATFAVTPVKDTTDATVYHATIAGAVTGLQTVSVTAFSDLSNNAGTTPANKVVNFSADTTKPTISSSKVEKINGIEYLVLTFNKNVNPTDALAINGTYVDNYVTTAMSPTLTTETTTPGGNALFTLYNPVDGKSTSVKLDLSALTKSAEYTVTLPATLVSDLFGNTSAEVTNFKFTRTTNSSTDAPKIDTTYGTDGVTVVDNNTIRVRFDRPVAGATAVTLANYTLEGTVLESATLLDNSAKGLVELKITKDSNTLTGVRTLAVSGITSQTGDLMTAATVAVPLNENVRPTVTKAELATTTTINITFSEAVSNATAVADTDFELYIGGTKSAKTVTVGAIAPLSETKTLVGTVSAAITAEDIAAGVTIKAVSTSDIADAKGNKANIPSAIPVQ